MADAAHANETPEAAIPAEDVEIMLENEIPDTAPDTAEETATEDASASLEQELLLMKDQLLRTMADAENYRKRSQRELEDANKYAVTAFARDMVGVLENLHRAIANIPAEARATDKNLDTLAEGVEMTQRELMSAFTRHGVRRLDPVAEKFDHNFHQAVAQIESADVPAGQIAQVLQAGYVIHDRLLRPAMVAVSKGSGGEAPAGVDTQA